MISVCIATYNGEKFIKDQLVSILNQLSEDDEIIVSDDGSSDHTISIIKALNDNRITILNHQRRKARFAIDHTTSNFENALMHAKGNHIFLSDQDDVWEKEKVETMLSALQSYDMVMSDCSVVNTELRPITTSYFDDVRSFKQSIVCNFIKSTFLGSCMAFNNTVLQKALPFPKYGVGHDLWLGMIGLRYFRFQYIHQPLIKYRRHSTTMTNAGKDNHTSLWFKAKYRLYVLWAMRRLIFR